MFLAYFILFLLLKLDIFDSTMWYFWNQTLHLTQVLLLLLGCSCFSFLNYFCKDYIICCVVSDILVNLSGGHNFNTGLTDFLNLLDTRKENKKTKIFFVFVFLCLCLARLFTTLPQPFDFLLVLKLNYSLKVMIF